MRTTAPRFDSSVTDGGGGALTTILYLDPDEEDGMPLEEFLGAGSRMSISYVPRRTTGRHRERGGGDGGDDWWEEEPERGRSAYR